MENEKSLITLGGKEWSLEGQTVSINDLISLDELGIDFKELEKESKLADDPIKNLRLIRALAYVMLKKVDSTLTIDSVGEMITIEKAGEVSSFFMDFFNTKLPKTPETSAT